MSTQLPTEVQRQTPSGGPREYMVWGVLRVNTPLKVKTTWGEESNKNMD